MPGLKVRTGPIGAGRQAVICQNPILTGQFQDMFSWRKGHPLSLSTSYVLMPVYFFALACSPNFTEPRILWSFLVLQFLLYPANSGLRNYFIKAESPDRPNKGLFWVSLSMALVAFLLALTMEGLLFPIMVFLFASQNAIGLSLSRIRKYPTYGRPAAHALLGVFAFLMCYEGINAFGLRGMLKTDVFVPALLSGLMVVGNPAVVSGARFTNKSLSSAKSAFLAASIMAAMQALAFALYFIYYLKTKYAVVFVASMVPLYAYLLVWAAWGPGRKVENPSWPWWGGIILASCLNGFIIYLFLDVTQVLQAIKAGF